MTTPMSLVAGLDIGNGYVKGVIRGAGDNVDQVDIPSSVVLVTRPNFVPAADSEAVLRTQGRETSTFFDELDVSFTSPMVGDTYRRLFGARSLNATGSFEEFDVVGRRSKAEQPLSKILVMGCLAAKAVKDHVRRTGSLPAADDTLSVKARIAIALPITEYMAHRHGYAAEYKTGSHVVTVHNFETPVTVVLEFEDVQVLPEGASAQYAITEKGEKLMNALLIDVRSRGLELPGITAADVLAARHTIGIDIGEGTVNLPVFTGGQFNADSSTTFAKGYGNVLTLALSSMEAQGVPGFNSRKQLAAYLQEGPSAIKRVHYDRIKRFVDEEIVFFAEEVAAHFGRLLAVVGATTEVVYVYGGGAGAVKDALYPLLLAKVKEMTGDEMFPVLYLDSRYSRHLNREGLYLAASKVALLAASKAPKAKVA